MVDWPTLRIRGARVAPGAPGIDPRWQHGDKDGVGTAYSADSKLWFTLWRGIVTEVYYPNIDHPQLRDLELLVTDGRSFFHEERRHLLPSTRTLDPHAPAYAITMTDPDGRYRLEKEVIAHPHLPVLLQRVRVVPTSPMVGPLRVYVLAAPHLGGGGQGNTGYVAEAAGRSLLLAERDGYSLAMGASVPFSQLSCGYVGVSDGWRDVSEHRAMEWEYDRAPNGNIALTAAIDPAAPLEFTLAIAFGRAPPYAIAALLQALGTSFEALREKYLDQWHRRAESTVEHRGIFGDGGRLWRTSRTTLYVHEDKSFAGAFIASLAIPWGNAKNDQDLGGYHLVWTRDLCQIATGLLAAGDLESPLRALIYLASNQRPDGGFPQNFWLTGEAYWGNLQLDEVAFPILLAGFLARDHALQEFDAYPMVRAAARFLVEHGPATGQERWEEVSGYSPSTLAVHIAALLIAAGFARQRSEPDAGRFLEEYADFLESHLEAWTTTAHGDLDPEHPRHYIRILPIDLDDPNASEDPETAMLSIANLAPGSTDRVPARSVIDAGFLQLVRHGIRRADDPLIVASLAVVDRVLRVDTPYGPCFRRYNHDGYGQRDDGGPFGGWGTGRAWPLLTGERGHYELQAGRDPRPYLRALERFATSTGLLPEQVWDQASLPSAHLFLGGPTGGATPLAWAHAEYLKLVRSTIDGHVFADLPEIERRYARREGARPPPLEIWKMNRRPRRVAPGGTLRILLNEPFKVHGSWDGWRTTFDLDSAAAPLDFHLLDLRPPNPGAELRFTPFYPGRGVWQGEDFAVQFDVP
jgi:glucoamylase